MRPLGAGDLTGAELFDLFPAASRIGEMRGLVRQTGIAACGIPYWDRQRCSR